MNVPGDVDACGISSERRPTTVKTVTKPAK